MSFCIGRIFFWSILSLGFTFMHFLIIAWTMDQLIYQCEFAEWIAGLNSGLEVDYILLVNLLQDCIKVLHKKFPESKRVGKLK